MLLGGARAVFGLASSHIQNRRIDALQSSVNAIINDLINYKKDYADFRENSYTARKVIVEAITNVSEKVDNLRMKSQMELLNIKQQVKNRDKLHQLMIQSAVK